MLNNSTSPIELWGAHTPRTMRPIWVAEELGLEYQHRPIGPRTGETQTEAFTTLNPKQKIPCMVDGDLVLTESLPIARYLISVYGNADLAAPTSPVISAKEDEWCCYVLGEIDETSLYVIRRHRDLAQIYGDSPVVVDASFAYLERHLKVVEAYLTGREYVLDHGFSLADVMMTTCLAWAQAYGAALKPDSAAYVERLTSRAAYRRASSVNYPNSA